MTRSGLDVYDVCDVLGGPSHVVLVLMFGKGRGRRENVEDDCFVLQHGD